MENILGKMSRIYMTKKMILYYSTWNNFCNHRMYTKINNRKSI